MLENIIATLTLFMLLILLGIGAIGVAILSITLMAVFYLALGCLYFVALCILPFYWGYNAIFKR